MTVVLWDINVSKRQSSGTLTSTPEMEQRMLSLDDYYEVARRCISAFASGSVRNSMLRSEDALSFVAEHLMYASCRWEADGGKTLYSYLNQCAIWAIRRWILISKNAMKNHCVSLNQSYEDQDELYSVISDGTDQPVDELCRKEEQEAIRRIMDSELTDRQRECIELIYIQGFSGADTARELGISRQAVEQCTTKGLTKIRMTLNEQICS